MEWKVLSIEKSQIYLVLSSLFRNFAPAYSKGEVLEWLKRHAWKACNRQNRFAGSNPVLSAGFKALR